MKNVNSIFSIIFRIPLITLDMGGPVADVRWAPYSSSVFSAVTDEGFIHVHDLHLRKCKALCSQNLVKSRPIFLTKVDFSPNFPIIIACGSR